MVQILSISLILFIISVVESSAANITSELLIELVDNNSTFQKGPPGVEIVPFDATTKATGIIKHTLGKRTNGDRVIAKGGDSHNYLSPRDIRIILTYPINGNGEIVTYVEITALQTSRSGRAYVLAGGIGQRHIKIALEAYSTTKLQYEAILYSSAPRMQSLGLLIPLVLLFCFSGSIL